MNVTFDRRGSVLLVVVEGRLDSADAVAFEETVRTTIEDGDAAVIMDLEKVVYISSAGLRAVLMTAKTLRKKEAAFAVCAPQGTVREVFLLSGLDKIITLHPSRAEALAALDD